MSTEIMLDYHGMPGQGRTVTKAKQDAGRKIAAALDGTYCPRLLECRGNAILVYRDPWGWRYAHVMRDGKPYVGQLDSGGSGYRDEGLAGSRGDSNLEATVRHCAIHLAQMGWTAEDELEPPPVNGWSRNLGMNDLREFRSWAEFQLRYQEARRLGMDDNDAHSYAGRNPARRELWQDHERASEEVAAS